MKVHSDSFELCREQPQFQPNIRFLIDLFVTIGEKKRKTRQYQYCQFGLQSNKPIKFNGTTIAMLTTNNTIKTIDIPCIYGSLIR